MKSNLNRLDTLKNYTSARPNFGADWLSIWSSLGFETPTPNVLLDIGCGTGRSTRWLAQQCGSVIGVDPDEASINIARQQNPEPKMTFHCCAAEEIAILGSTLREVDALVFSGSFDWIDVKRASHVFTATMRRNLPTVCIWSWFDTRDEKTRQLYKFFRRYLGSTFGMDGCEVLAKAQGTLLESRSAKIYHQAVHTEEDLVSLVTSSSYWKPRCYPWDAQGLKEAVRRFLKVHGESQAITLKFVDVAVGGHFP